MRKLKIMEHISLDGVIQHSADKDDFPYADWTAPYPARAFELLSSTAFPSGIVFSTYRAAGLLKSAAP